MNVLGFAGAWPKPGSGLVEAVRMLMRRVHGALDPAPVRQAGAVVLRMAQEVPIEKRSMRWFGRSY